MKQPNILLQIDPELSRTVIVSTKLDTKIPQFARSSDVEVFLLPPSCTLDGIILGDSPFFTSVPSGRVGSGHDSVYKSNDEFKEVSRCKLGFIYLFINNTFSIFVVELLFLELCG